jgi:hypothetical protein
VLVPWIGVGAACANDVSIRVDASVRHASVRLPAGPDDPGTSLEAIVDYVLTARTEGASRLPDELPLVVTLELGASKVDSDEVALRFRPGPDLRLEDPQETIGAWSTPLAVDGLPPQLSVRVRAPLDDLGPAAACGTYVPLQVVTAWSVATSTRGWSVEPDEGSVTAEPVRALLECARAAG